MHALVDRLLTLARADARQLTVRPEPVEVRTVLDDAWDTVANLAARRDITPDFAAVPPGLTIRTDPEILRIVVKNALDNAATYAPPGSAVTVRADLAPTGAAAGPTLSFTNPAPGMTPEQASRVFDRFWRADDARQAGHVGLGLPLCQKLMQSLAGDARVSLHPPDLYRLTLQFPK
jgi:two-component system OmpR family sensor kinase